MFCHPAVRPQLRSAKFSFIYLLKVIFCFCWLFFDSVPNGRPITANIRKHWWTKSVSSTVHRVRDVDGSCAEHLTVESYTAIYAANIRTYYY